MPATGIYREITMPSIAEAWFPIEDAPPMSSPARRVTDVNRLSFQMPTVAAIVIAAIGIAGSQYFFQSGIRSDLRDMRTRLELQAEVDKARNEARTTEIKAFNDRVEMLNQSMADLRRLTQMLQIQYQELNAKGSQ
jgi:hypothetical protein